MLKPIDLLKLELLNLIHCQDRAWLSFESSPDGGWADSINNTFTKSIEDYKKAIETLENKGKD